MSTEDKNLLTVYPQRKWHHNAYVVGNRKGLEELRRAIDKALKATDNISVGLAVVEPIDCETYYLAVVLDDNENDDMDTAYWDSEVADRTHADGNSMVPNERYVMAVGVEANKAWRKMIKRNKREIEASHAEQETKRKK